MSIESRDLTERVAEFKDQGYTIFKRLYSQEQVQEWRFKYEQLHQELFAGNDKERYPITDMVERSPSTMLPFTANPAVLNFIESIMGPFIQIGDAGFTGFSPQPKEKVENKVTGWHRDMYAMVPRGNDYQIPRQVLALSYLEDMNDENGPLRVLPHTHRREAVLQRHERGIPHPDELKLDMKAGDVIVFSGILHTGSHNTSPDRFRILMGGMYTNVWYRPNCNFDGPNIKTLIREAAARNDRRMLRLLGNYGQVEKNRTNSGFTIPTEQQWQDWIAEDNAALIGPADWWQDFVKRILAPSSM